MNVSRLIVLCLVTGCAGSNDYDLKIEGTVRVLEGNSSVPGAIVTLTYQQSEFEIGGVVTQSDAFGNYTFTTTATPCHNLVLSVEATGYKTATSGVECTDQLQRLDFALSPP